MEQSPQHIVAHFIQKSPDEIRTETPIDRSAVAGSIIIHRMYASLAEAGFAVEEYHDIHTFGELQARLQGVTTQTISTPTQEEKPREDYALGVDVQSIEELPETSDFRNEPFYKQSFSPTEIAYCILQSNPRQSFAGLYAAKEALVKADASLAQRPLRELVLTHAESGKPVYDGFQLSISHSGDIAMAAAMAKPVQLPETEPDVPRRGHETTPLLQSLQNQNRKLKRIVWASSALALMALCLSLIQYFQLV